MAGRMAEVLVSFTDPVLAADGTLYHARACGRERPDGRWEGWIEFESADGDVVRTARETTQPNRTDTAYWATGLTAVYLEGALARALNPPLPAPPEIDEIPAFEGPRPAGEPPASAWTESVIDPFSVYRKGEAHLRRQLEALAAWHLVNIVESHRLSDVPTYELNRMPADQLVELIVSTVRLTAGEKTTAD